MELGILFKKKNREIVSLKIPKHKNFTQDITATQYLEG